jgi:hypothetical protein
MKTFVMIRVWKVQAPSWFQVCVQFKKIEDEGRLGEFLVYDRVKEEKPKGF